MSTCTSLRAAILILFLVHYSRGKEDKHMEDISNTAAEKRAAALFQEMDKDKNNSLDWTELMPHIGGKVSEMAERLKLTTDEYKGFYQHYDLNGNGIWDDDELMKMFEYIDTDEEGSVSHGELVKFIVREMLEVMIDE